MAIERCVATTFPAATGVTNPTYATDAPTSGTNMSTYSSSSDTTSATLSSGFVTRTFYLSGFAAKTQAWTAATLYYYYTVTTFGDGALTQWDSTADVSYCTDWNGTTGTFTNYISNDAGDNGGPITYMGTITLSASQNPATVAIKFFQTGHAKTGVLPDFILAAQSTVNLYHAFIDGTYTPLSITSLNSGAYCNIGSTYTLTGVGFTGVTVASIAAQTASFSVVNDTTINLTIPPLGAWGALSVGVFKGGSWVYGTGYINTPSVSVSPGVAYKKIGYTQQFTGTTSNLADTTVNWSCSGGSITTGGLYTAPTPGYHGQGYTITATANGNPTYTSNSATCYVYYAPVLLTFTSTAYYIINGTGVTFNWTSNYADTGVMSNWGAGMLAANSSIVVTPPSNATTYYQLYGQNNAGTGNGIGFNIVAMAMPAITNYGATAYNILYGNTTQVQCTFSGGGTLTCKIGTSAGGSQITANAVSGTYYTTPAITSTTTIYMTVSNEATSVSASFNLFCYGVSITNNGPVLLDNTVNITPSFTVTTSLNAPSVSPGSWSAWTSGTAQSTTLLRNTLYTITQTGSSQSPGSTSASTVAQAKLPTTPTASMSMSQMRQICGGSGTFDVNNTYLRIIAGSSASTNISFSTVSNGMLSTAYYW